MIYPVLQDFGNLQYMCHDVFAFAWKQIGPGSELLVSKAGTDRKDWTIVSKLNVHVTYWKLDKQLPTQPFQFCWKVGWGSKFP